MQEISIQWIFEETGNRRFFVYCENIIIFIKKIFMLWIQIKKNYIYEKHIKNWSREY